ncbi:MAG: pyridoxal phosphate-dependent decarboxylase family protein [Terracidiphilus sp.]
MRRDPFMQLLADASEALETEFGGLPGFEPETGASAEAMAQVLAETAHRLGDNYPYFHPLYAGQMLKAPHPVARAAYALAMKINPNNHALDGGRASSAMEIEAVREIAGMFAWSEFLGHLTSSGTFANLEALWMAGQLRPGLRIVGSEQAHYTHQRISAVLRLEFKGVAADERGRMSLGALEDELRKGDVGTVVATLGTTALGAVDPLDEILALACRYGARVHVDAAYGGYFGLIADALEEPARRAYAAMGGADSIAIDPHKHGLQPYGCGCVLFRDPAVGRFYKHDSPYTYFTSKALHLHPIEQKSLAGDPVHLHPIEQKSLAGDPVHLHPIEQKSLAGDPVHLGEISLECSRAGAAAVALWATQRLLPLTSDGAFAEGLRRGRRAALELDRRLRADERFAALAVGMPELDIVVWAVRGPSAQQAALRAQQVFDACAARGLHLALVQLPESWFWPRDGDTKSSGAVKCLRSVLMKPEHEAWMGEIWERLSASCAEIFSAY